MPKGRLSPDRRVVTEPRALSLSDELTISASGVEVRRASAWLDLACRKGEVPSTLAERLALCLHEILANVIDHGGESARSAPITLALSVSPDRSGSKVNVTVSDSGIAFNPLSVPQITQPKTLEKTLPRGLGLLMIRRCAGWLDYRHEGGRNHFTFGAGWESAMKAPGIRRFHRGPDRRVANAAATQERRRSDRRTAEIQWIPLFRNAGQRDLSEALADCEVLLLPAGTPLLRAGEANRSVFVLLSGKLVAYLGADGDADTAIDIDILPGECIGELSAIDGKPISALVRAESDVRVLQLDRDVFWSRLMRLNGVAENLMTTLTGRMRRANERALFLQRERLELKHLKSELEVARQLQASMLPLQRPLFPGRTDIDVCGFMEPASKIGGDLFDAFFIDNRTLFVCIGDVSGHGIAAALFMVRVIGLLRILAMETAQPEKILETLNDRLCIGNDANLFVTLFCGFLDVQTGDFVYANAGHCAPMLCRGREVAPLPLPKGALVGAASGRHYSSRECNLAIGTTLFCYTDGVTEAENPAGIPFTEGGCLEALRHGAESPIAEILDSLHERVIIHTGSKVLVDDCTMLALRRLAPAD